MSIWPISFVTDVNARFSLGTIVFLYYVGSDVYMSVFVKGSHVELRIKERETEERSGFFIQCNTAFQTVSR